VVVVAVGEVALLLPATFLEVPGWEFLSVFVA